MAYAFGAALAYLTAAAVTDEAGLDRQVCPIRKGRGDLGGWIETAEGRAQRCGGDGDDRAAQQTAWSQPLDAVRHQTRDRQQAAELERSDEVAGDALVGRCRPGAVESMRTGTGKRLLAGEPPGAAGAENRIRSAAASAGSA
jgi:hypothetical protein